MKIGILGGTFDPIHIGHLVLARECSSFLKLDKVIFVPAHISPHKKEGMSVSAEDRCEMVRIAIFQEEGFEISTYETDKQGVSYSIDTIEHFKKEYGPSAEIFFLTGSDSEEGLSTWQDIDRVLDISTFVIATRPGWSGNTPYEDRIKRVSIPAVSISATIIRDRVKASKDLDDLVPVSVAKYIRDKGLYE